MTADLMRIMLLTFLIFAVSNVFTWSAPSAKHFWRPRWARCSSIWGRSPGDRLVPRLSIYGVAWGGIC
ncbi:MAG: hypothetical protein R2854_13925 [Caldilineaceae bacterium]